MNITTLAATDSLEMLAMIGEIEGQNFPADFYEELDDSALDGDWTQYESDVDDSHQYGDDCAYDEYAEG